MSSYSRSDMRRRRSLSDSRSEMEKEKERRRIQWMIQQEKLREHERLKKKKIEEYERKRAEALGLPYKGRSTNRSRSHSRSRSRSEESHHRSHHKSKNSKPQVMSEKLNSSEDNRPLFKGPEESMKLEENELRLVTVKIQRKIPAPATDSSEIKRNVVNPEEITLKRREGEGSKPLFDREELKKAAAQSLEVEEHRTVVAVGRTSTDKRVHPKRRSVSLSPRRRRSVSPHERPSSTSHSHSSHRSRREEHPRYRPEDRHRDHRSDRYHQSRDRAREHSREEPRRRRSPRVRSHSRERDYSRSSRSEKEYRDRSKERAYERERRERRDSPRERRLSAPTSGQYVEPVPYPLYYGGFAPRPMLIGPPMPAIRAPMSRGRVPPCASLRPPFPPRFIAPQDMYRAVLPPDPRFGRMY